MKTHVDKSSGNRSRLVADRFQKQKGGGASPVKFEDNRSEAVAQRKLQEVANKGAQVSPPKLKAFQEMANTDYQQQQATQLQALGNFGKINDQQAPISSLPVQLYQYNRGNTMNITLNSGTSNNSKSFEICTSNQVKYDKGDMRQFGTATGKADWQGWLIDNGTTNNATQLHVVNQEWGGLGGTADGNIGPGSQQLNGHHKGPEAKYKNLFDSNGIAKYDMTYDCKFDYGDGNGLLNQNNSTITNDVIISDPIIYCDIVADDRNGENFGEGWVVPGSNAAGMKIRNGG